jgi:hypothetical protein
MEPRRCSVAVQVPGFRMKYEGSQALYEDLLRDAVQPVADGQWRSRPAEAPAAAAAPPAPAPAPALPRTAPPAPAAAPAPWSPAPAVAGWTAAPAAPARPFAVPHAPPPTLEERVAAAARGSGLPAPAAPVAAVPGRPAPAVPGRPAPAPAPAAPARGVGGSGWDPAAMIRALAGKDNRSAEKDAVLTAVVGLAAEGKRDCAPADIKAWLERHGFPAGEIHVKPILGKLHSRHNHVVPGILPGTFRPTPAGTAHIFRRSQKG